MSTELFVIRYITTTKDFYLNVSQERFGELFKYCFLLMLNINSLSEVIVRLSLLIDLMERKEITVSEYKINSIPRNKSNDNNIIIMKEKGKYVENLIGKQIKRLQPKTLIEVTKKLKNVIMINFATRMMT